MWLGSRIQEGPHGPFEVSSASFDPDRAYVDRTARARRRKTLFDQGPDVEATRRQSRR